MRQNNSRPAKNAVPNVDNTRHSPTPAASDSILPETNAAKTTGSSPILFFMLWFGIPMLLIIGLAFAMSRS